LEYATIRASEKRDIINETINYKDTHPDDQQLLEIIKKGSLLNNQGTYWYAKIMTIIRYILIKTTLGVVKTTLSV
jgi:hypothetical protein